MKKNVDYNTIYRSYDSSRVANIETVNKLNRLLHIDSDSVVLDMGCGTGNYSAALQNLAKQVIGIDKSKGMIDRAISKFPTLTIIHGDVTSIPFRAYSFDGCFSIDVLHHVGQKLRFLQEAYRVLREGGQIAIRYCSHNQLKSFWYYHYFPAGLEVDLARLPDSAEIRELFSKAGFSNVNIEICYYDEVVAREVPEDYLDKAYRDSISTFAYLSYKDIESGCEKLRSDVMSGYIYDFVYKSKEASLKQTGTSSIIYGQKTA